MSKLTRILESNFGNLSDAIRPDDIAETEQALWSYIEELVPEVYMDDDESAVGWNQCRDQILAAIAKERGDK